MAGAFFTAGLGRDQSGDRVRCLGVVVPAASGSCRGPDLPSRVVAALYSSAYVRANDPELGLRVQGGKRERLLRLHHVDRDRAGLFPALAVAWTRGVPGTEASAHVTGRSLEPQCDPRRRFCKWAITDPGAADNEPANNSG